MSGMAFQPESSPALKSQDLPPLEIFKRLESGASLTVPGMVGDITVEGISGKFTSGTVDTSTFLFLRDLGIIEVARHTGFFGDEATYKLASEIRTLAAGPGQGREFLFRLLEKPSRGIPFSNDPYASDVDIRQQRMLADKLLLLTSKEGDVDGIKNALLMGANPEATVKADRAFPDYDGLTALMFACWAGPDAYEGAKALLDAGADVNRRAPSGNNAILFAAQGAAKYGNHDKDAEPLINLLMARGSGADDGFSNGKTPLFICVNEYDGVISDSAIRALLKHGANPNAKVHYDSYTLDILTHVAWSANGESRGGIEAVKLLVEAGAEINVAKGPVNHLTSTPLGAVAESSPFLTEYLLARGADPLVIAHDGTTLLQEKLKQLDDYRQKGYPMENHSRIVALLEQALARRAERQ